MKKPASITLIILLLAITGLFAYSWYGADSIAKAAIATKAILFKEPIVGEERIITWLEKYHGEAPSHEVMITFAFWSISNASRSRSVIENLSEEAIDRVVWAIYDSGLTKQFLAAHGHQESGNLAKIISQLKERRQSASANKKFKPTFDRVTFLLLQKRAAVKRS